METDAFTDVSQKLGGISRRDFIKFCSVLAAGLGLPLGAGEKIAEAVVAAQRPPVIWLSFQECTGCVESLLRSSHPTLEHLILDLISLDYSETLSAAAGHQAEAAKADSILKNKGKFVLVVDGAVPTKDKGIYCKIGGKTALEILQETAPHAAAIIGLVVLPFYFQYAGGLSPVHIGAVMTPWPAAVVVAPMLKFAGLAAWTTT